MKRFTSLAAAVFTAAFLAAATSVSAQDSNVDQRTYLTFSGPVQMPGVTLCQVAIHTGRTHQIRVHLSAIGHPIVGDALYGGVHRRVAGDIRAVQRLERPFLHAARVVFKHPGDGRRMQFIARLPEDLQNVLDDLPGWPPETD